MLDSEKLSSAASLEMASPRDAEDIRFESENGSADLSFTQSNVPYARPHGAWCIMLVTFRRTFFISSSPSSQYLRQMHASLAPPLISHTSSLAFLLAACNLALSAAVNDAEAGPHAEDITLFTIFAAHATHGSGKSTALLFPLSQILFSIRSTMAGFLVSMLRWFKQLALSYKNRHRNTRLQDRYN